MTVAGVGICLFVAANLRAPDVLGFFPRQLGIALLADEGVLLTKVELGLHIDMLTTVYLGLQVRIMSVEE